MIKQIKGRPKNLKGIKPIISKKASYAYSRAEFFINSGNMYISLSGAGVKKIWFIISSYKMHTALEILTTVNWGRHFEDGVLDIWHKEGLDFGWSVGIFKKILKDSRR